MSGKSSGASSRSGGASSNAGERSVRQAEYAVPREAVNDRLDAMRPVRPRTGGGSKRLRTVPPRTGGGSKRLRACSGTSRMFWTTSKPTKTLKSRTVTRDSITVRLPLAIACQMSYD